MATLPAVRVALRATFGVFALFGAVLVGTAPIAEASVSGANSGSAHVASFVNLKDIQDPDPNPAPMIHDPPEVQSPSNPGQKAPTPRHYRSTHRAPM
jgi:hypothetical protein